jgi:hypothetical protein
MIREGTPSSRHIHRFQAFLLHRPSDTGRWFGLRTGPSVHPLPRGASIRVRSWLFPRSSQPQRHRGDGRPSARGTHRRTLSTGNDRRFLRVADARNRGCLCREFHAQRRRRYRHRRADHSERYRSRHVFSRRSAPSVGRTTGGCAVRLRRCRQRGRGSRGVQ